MSFFLGIPHSDLIAPQIPLISPTIDFDAQVRTWHSHGLNYAQIARQMGASYDVVKAIGGGRYKKYHYYKDNPRQGGAKRKDWKSLDTELLPKVKALVGQMTSTDNRPSMVTLGRVERLLGLRDKSMDNLPTCREYILKHTISQEQFWALTLDWAVALLQKVFVL